jgi:hypothetical protein
MMELKVGVPPVKEREEGTAVKNLLRRAGGFTLV